MSDKMATAESLRKRFRDIPSDAREANQPFSIRMWRGISWLERSESIEDTDSRFIALWIAFNAIYGCVKEDGLSARDRETWQAFVTRIIQADKTDQLGQILQRNQLKVLHLIENRYLFRPFWLGDPDADKKLAAARRSAMVNFQNHSCVGIFQELFERLYVLRSQVFHGAATAHSKLNREYLESATGLLAEIAPTMIGIMLEAGPAEDWGSVCFPPMADDA